MSHGNDATGQNESSDGLLVYGAMLKAYREAVGLSQEELAHKVGYSSSYVAKFEQGKRFPPEDFVERAGELFGASKVLHASARKLKRRKGIARYFEQWASLEEEAVCLLAYECRAIPGLLQPPSYVKAILDSHLPPAEEDAVQKHLDARLERQQLFITKPTTNFSFIIEQSLIERRFGGADVTRDVINNLLEKGSRRNVEIQIMPTRQEDHAGGEGLMYLAETADLNWTGYVEAQCTSLLINDTSQVSGMLQRYGRLRSQALSTLRTARLLEDMQGEL